MQLLVEPAKKADALSLIAGVDVSSMSLTLAKETHTLLAKVFKDESAASAFKAKALQRFPVCGHFGGTAPKLIEGPTLPNAQTAPTSAP